MDIVVKEVIDSKDLKKFINFPYQLYKNHPYYVPPLKFDEELTLRKDKNPSFDYCEARYWLAFKEDKVVGRIAAILNKSYIEKWGNKYLRFGWIDFEKDINITKALLLQVEQWAAELGMKAVHGPMGFTDLDHEGMLIEGFDQLGTLATIYNYPYYPKFMEELGYSKDVDWVEYKITLPTTVPEKLEKIASIVQRRSNVQVAQVKSAREIKKYAKDIFDLINSTYSELYGVVPLTEKQIKAYTNQYFSFIKPDFVPLVLDSNGKLIAFAVSMPSLSKALQKAKGSLFPFGFMYILQAMRKNTMGDLYLVGVDKAYQGKGINAILMHELTKTYLKYNLKYAESNPELEHNKSVQALWEYYDATQHKRRRCFIKHINS